MPKHRETLRLAEYANIIMEVLFLLKLIKSFIEAHYHSRAAQRPQDVLCWGTELPRREDGGRAGGGPHAGPLLLCFCPFPVALLEVQVSLPSQGCMPKLHCSEILPCLAG